MKLTLSASRRMQKQSITEQDIELTLEFGRSFHCRGAEFKVIGEKEITRYRDQIDLRAQAGIHAVISSDGAVITTYRNQSFKRSDFRKPKRRRFRGALPRRLAGQLLIPAGE